MKTTIEKSNDSMRKSIQCMECGAKANKTVQGRCAACGSARVKNLKKLGEQKEKEAQPVRLFLMILLWVFMIYKSYETFIAS